MIKIIIKFKSNIIDNHLLYKFNYLNKMQNFNLNFESFIKSFKIVL